MSSEVDPGYHTKSMVSKRGTKGTVVVAVVVSDVSLEMILRASERTADGPYLYGNFLGVLRGGVRGLVEALWRAVC